MTTRIVEVRAGVLRQNDAHARVLRARFEHDQTFVVNLVSSPGAGKTTFLTALLRALRAGGHRVAALVGDLETDLDAQRLAQSGAPVRQINTHGRCHLEAEMIETHLRAWDQPAPEFLFIENVGNLVCPASYDLGEALRIVLLSVTEGEDKPLKYPGMFNSADLAVVTKIDLAEACEYDRAAARAAMWRVRPQLPIWESSAKSGNGLDALVAELVRRRTEWGRPSPVLLG